MYKIEFSVHLGHFVDATERWVPVLHFETFALQSGFLHAIVIERADGVQIGALSKLLELLWGLVEFEHLLHTVVVLANVVLMLVDAKSSIDLILETKHFYTIDNLTNNQYIIL